MTIAVGLGMAGLVVAADAGTGRHAWLRRVLDGAVTAGAVFMAGWVLLGRAGDGWRPETGMIDVLWASEVVSLGFLLVLRRLVRGDQQVTVWAAIVGLFLMLIGDTLRLRMIGGPHGPEAMSFQLGDVCVTAGLLAIAVGPWVPGGGSVLVVGRPMLRSGSAFIVLTVCTVTALGYALAPLAYDPVSLLTGGTVMLGLWARQTFLPSENTGEDDCDTCPARRIPCRTGITEEPQGPRRDRKDRNQPTRTAQGRQRCTRLTCENGVNRH
ncbi:hypothetical protein [Streptomyces canus]|uniref:hypothetical protein n=1 Tax=Streptomyces canus TaxID=58343 RepID=UPI0036E90C17